MMLNKEAIHFTEEEKQTIAFGKCLCREFGKKETVTYFYEKHDPKLKGHFMSLDLGVELGKRFVTTLWDWGLANDDEASAVIATLSKELFSLENLFAVNSGVLDLRLSGKEGMGVSFYTDNGEIIEEYGFFIDVSLVPELVAMFRCSNWEH